VTTRSEVRTIDDLGRPTSVKQLGDTDPARTDDDVCIDTEYAKPNGQDERVLLAISTRKVTDCGTTIYARDTFQYDGLDVGNVSTGLPTSHTVERRDEAGAPHGEVREFDATFNAYGNPDTMTTKREGGVSRTATVHYEDFQLGPDTLTTTATGLPDMTISLTRDPLTLNVTSTLDPNLTRYGTRFDGFDRPVIWTVTPPGGTEGALSFTSYQGFGGGDSQGRRVTSKVFTDAVPPGTASTAAGRTATVYLDELGRARLTEKVLGADYPNLTMKADLTYDSLGRLLFATDPYPSNQDTATAYGTTRYFNADGTPLCFIRGKGKQQRPPPPQQPSAPPMATNEASELYPTCFSHGFQDHTEVVRVRDAASLLANSPQEGVTKSSSVTATGRLISRATLQGSTRLEYATFTQDRLGHLASMTRYQNAASGTDPVTSSWHTDSLGEVVELDEPDSPAQSNVYSQWGELVETNRIQAGSLRRVVQTYDALGRVTHSEHQTAGVVDPETVHDYAYDTAVQVAPQVTATNVLGRLAKASWPTGAVTYSYDGQGRNNAQVFTDTKGGLYVEKHTFHGDGSPSALELFLPDTAYAKEQVDYTYDSAGRGLLVKYTNGDEHQDLYKASTIDPFGRVRNAQYGPATYTADYADVGRRLLNKVAVASPLGSRSISYSGFDPVGRERSRTEIKDDQGSGATTTWTYDALGRLSSAVQTGSATTNFNQQFTYDPLGNLLKIANTGTPGATDTTLSYSTTDRDRICRVAFGTDSRTTCNVTYDELGSILSQPTPTGSRQYTYLVDGSVRTITDDHGSVANFRYDAFGEVQELDLDPGPTGTSTDVRRDRHYGSLITRRQEQIGSSSPLPAFTRKIPLHDGSVATRHGSGGPWTFEYGEQRGNRFFTDQTGAFVQDVNYQPFGKPTSTIAQPGSQLYSNKQWNGGDALAAFGISQLGARLYDPAIGRFISRDPLLIPRTAATTNPYAFASNDPVNSSDPTGLCDEPSNKDGSCTKKPEDRGGEVTKSTDTTGTGTGSTGGTPPPSSTTGITVEPGRTGQGVGGHPTGTGGSQRPGTGGTSTVDAASARALVNIARGQAVWDAAMQTALAANRAQELEAWQKAFRIFDDLPSNRTVMMDGSQASWDRAKLNAMIGSAGLAGVIGAMLIDSAVAALAAPPAAGAGGGWKTIAERAGGTVAQITPTSCGPACGQIVSGIPQEQFIATLGPGVQSVYGLQSVMGAQWAGGWIQLSKLPLLLAKGRPFVAQMRDFVSGSYHFVAVMGQRGGQLLIEDPWNGGSTYRMEMREFIESWTTYGVFPK
jgi:RHS repeat-associated protein